MQPEQFYAQRDDRTARYGERRLDPQRAIIVTAETAYIQTLEGQVAVITLATSSRMSPEVSLGFASAALHPALPFQAEGLHALVLGKMRGADPFGRFEVRSPRDGDYAVHLGPKGPGWVSRQWMERIYRAFALALAARRQRQSVRRRVRRDYGRGGDLQPAVPRNGCVADG